MTNTNPEDGGGGDRKRKLKVPPVTPELDREEARVKRAQLNKAEEEQAVIDAEHLPPAPEGPQAAVVGALVVKYLDVGQGDCTLIITPLGKKIMIDCGADPGSPVLDGAEDEQPDAANLRRTTRITDAVRTVDFLGTSGENPLDILILTHSDRDHINLISDALKDVKIGRVYHSGRYGSYQGTMWDTVGDGLEKQSPGLSSMALIYDVRCRQKKGNRATVETAVLVNDKPLSTTAVKTDGVPTPDTVLATFGNGSGDELLHPGDAVRVLREQAKGVDICTVTFLAGNVERGTYAPLIVEGVTVSDGGGVDGTNCGSLVTLVVAHGVKYLFTGDATRSTEGHLIGRHSARIADAAVVTAPHHGSGETSSTPDFIAAVKPASVVFSAGRQYSNYAHPRWSALRRYLIHFAGRKLTTDSNTTVVFWPGTAESDLKGPPPPTNDTRRAALGIQSTTAVATPILYKGQPQRANMTFPIHPTGLTVMTNPPVNG